MNLEVIERLLAPIKRRIAGMALRGVVRLVNDAGGIQVVQAALHDGPKDGVERFQQYGLTSNPHDVAEGIFLALSGHRSHTVMIACDDRRYRLKNLASGEVSLYDDLGQKVHLKRTGMQITTPLPLVIDAPAGTTHNGNMVVVGNLSATGNVSDATGSMQTMRGQYNEHSNHVGGTPPNVEMS